jgi:hypothetical protein
MFNNDLVKYSKERCQEIAQEIGENQQVLTAILGKKKNGTGQFNAKGKEILKAPPATEKETLRLRDRLYEELNSGIELSFFVKYGISHDFGQTVQYFGNGILKLYRDKIYEKKLPYIKSIKFQICYKDLTEILKKQSFYRKNRSVYYAVPYNMIYGLEQSIEKVNRQYKKYNEEVRAMNATIEIENASLPEGAIKKELKEEKKMMEASDLGMIFIPRLTSLDEDKEYEILGACGSYITSDNKEQEIYWVFDHYNNSINEHSPFRRYPIATIETKFTIACYKKEYGKEFVKYSDEEMYENETNYDESHMQVINVKAIESINKLTLAEEVANEIANELD